MGGKSSQEQQTQQTTSTGPWSQALPAVQGILGGVNGQINNYQPTGTETGALNTLMSNAQSGNPYAGAIQGNATNLLSGGGANAQAPAVQSSYDALQSRLNPFANGSMVGAGNPQLQSVLDTIRSDVGNSVNGLFAGAGRDASGMNQQTLARGIAQGEAAPLLGQYNTDIQNQINSAYGLNNAQNATSGILSGLNQTALGNQQQGTQAAQDALAARDSSANQVLNVSGQQRQLPLQNLGLLENLTTPIAQLGSTGQSNGTSNTTANMSPVQQFAMLMGGLGKLWGK